MASSSRNYRTPISNRKRVRRDRSSRSTRSAVDTLAGMAADATGYGSAYRGGKLAFSTAKKLFKGKTNKTSGFTKRGYSGYTKYAGKLSKGKKFSKRISRKGQMG